MIAGLPVGKSLAYRSRVRDVTLAALSVVALLSLSGCGDGGGDTADAASQTPSTAATAPAAPSPAGSVNQSPTIAGIPNTSVMPGTLYSFTPTAVDADGDILSFSISGRPLWCAFNASTGQLRGTPTQGDIGTTSSIVISVTDGEATAQLTSFTISVVGTASGSALLSWLPPTENDDGSALTNLVGYKVYWGTSPGDYSNSVTLTNPGLTSYVIEQLTPATWYFVTTAMNADGVESDYSNVATKIVM